MRGSVGALCAIALVAACARETPPLPGERLDVFGGSEAAERGPTPISLPAQSSTPDWTHVNGGPEHRLGHLALPAQIARIWSADIGQGDTRRHRITAAPIVADGRIVTLDSLSTVSAFGPGGGVLWRRDLTPAGDRATDASGGGLAAAGGRVFVSTGFGELVALDAGTGGVAWRQDLAGAASGAPAVRGDTVYVVSRGGRGLALDAATGRIRWEVGGVADTVGVTGAAGPSVTSDLAILPFGSGEVFAARADSGERVWTASVTGGRAGRAFSGISDITGAPVVDGGRIYVGNSTGRVVALDAATGARDWTAATGALGPVWPIAGSVFLVSDIGEIVRLDAATGETIWSEPLPYFQNRRPKRRKAVYAHYGPVLAGGRVLVAGSDGVLRSFSPESGALVSSVEVPGGASSAPVVVNGTLYVIGSNGQLHAYR